MERSLTARERSHKITSNAFRTVGVHAALLFGAAAAVFLVGGPQQGSLGVFFVCAGAVMVACPPRVRVDWPLWIAAGGIVACGGLAFLPARWFHVPLWRSALASVPMVQLPSSVSPAPWATGFWLGVMAITALTGLFALAHPLRTAGVVGLGTAAVVVGILYTALAIYAKETGWHYPFAGTATFGFFPNRNHTATFLVIGSILALGLLRIAWRDGRWTVGTLAGAGLTLFVAALGYYSVSRGGIVFLLVGMAIWAAGLGRREQSLPLVVSLGVLLLAGGGLFAVSGSEVRHRLLAAGGDGNAPSATGESIPSELRIPIYEDASRLVCDMPLTGVGLGAFAAVFPQYREKSLNGAAAIHPESDWLMLAAEAGVPATVLAALLGGGLLRRSSRWRQHPSWPLRWACVAAVAAACLHGIVDVPLHRVVLGWWVLVLAGIGLHGGWSEDTGRSWIQHACFVAGGLAALTLGVCLIRAQWFGSPPLPPFQAAAAAEDIAARIKRQDYDGALARAQDAVQVLPTVAPLYFQLGTLLLHYDGTDAEAERAFNAQRVLNPTWPSVPLQQGDVWLTIDPRRAASLWLEALERHQRVEHAQTGKPTETEGYFRQLVARARLAPDAQRELARAVAGHPAYLLAFVEEANLDVLAGLLPRLVAENADDLEQLPTSQREKLLLNWYRRGSREELARFLDEHPAWAASAWPVQLRQLVDGQHFEQAVHCAAEHYQITLDLPEATNKPSANLPDDPAAEFEDAWQQGNAITARRVLGEAINAPNSPVNPEVLRLKAALAAHDADWSAAWQALDGYLRQTRPRDYFP